jgi:signal transduction histidine kinase/CheY-like chemotaxis protein/CHASE3 domain sensor protein
MTDRISPTKLGQQARTSLLLGLIAILILFLGSGLVSYINTSTLQRNAELVTHTHEVLSALADVLSLVKDAETGQRGYLLTGNEQYLEPHSAAMLRINARVDEIERLTDDNRVQQARIPPLRTALKVKLDELEETIALRRNQGVDAARAVVLSDRGKAAMDAIRDQIGEMQQDERDLRAARFVEMKNAYWVAIASGIVTGLIGVLLSISVTYLVRRAALTRQFQDWLQAGQIGISVAAVGDVRLEKLGDNVLRFFAEYLDATAGAFFVKVGGSYRRVATYGVAVDGGAPVGFEAGDGLLGQAVKDRRVFIVHDVPDGYLTLSSALGRGQPRHLLIVPFISDESANAVLELGFLQPIDESVTQLFERISESVAVAVQSVNFRTNLQNLLQETQRQAEELQAQSEELRVSNEELEEQSRALKESQTRLELQQAELEQTNVQLEEQTTLLEAQRDEASRSKTALQVQARELEQASQYKSDFLANMSHELRTPLNSSLILAKLLADNREGNLTAEQIQFAETIRSAGNDLLALINDILDLSKIEAGHMEIRPEMVRLNHMTDDLVRTFLTMAEQKGLVFRTQILPGCPEMLHTDRLRLEQVLKNVLSNAIKFTEKGEVTLSVSLTTEGRIAFAVTDTGIGIAEHQQEVVFEAFRQADGTTNRKYGGTGLGLSISRELTRLLGGEIHLKSQPGRGSTFTVTVPENYDAALVRPRQSAAMGQAPTVTARPAIKSSLATIGHIPTLPPAGPQPPRRTRRFEDDRERLTGNSRVILAVEDDEPFAKILFDLAHELRFECLIATTAEEGLAMAIQYLPSAVVLDVGLPDHSGLSVLDRLKHDSRTRHIPVHVVSAGDYAQTAMALGAVGYMLKPVKREALVEALERLETRLSQRMRRVLVVEDDPVQLDSLRRLLGSRDVETVGVGNAAGCLEHLKEATFDCMVLDLSLPDASGYSLLETLSREDTYAFPPVIVYTGRELSVDEEQQLRRYSKSIIIKGAKSPERLLDEVTLFLHQVVSELPPEQQRMLEKARSRDAAIEGRRILVVEDDVRNVFAITSILEPRGAVVQIARNGREALEAIRKAYETPGKEIDLVLMDVMMPEMDGITATREIRKRPEWKKLPVLMLTAKAMKDDQEQCLSAGANDYMAKPLDVEKLLSLVRVWMPR